MVLYIFSNQKRNSAIQENKQYNEQDTYDKYIEKQILLETNFVYIYCVNIRFIKYEYIKATTI